MSESVSAESESRRARRDVGIGDVRGELVVLEERDLERGEDGFVVRRADRRCDACSVHIVYDYFLVIKMNFIFRVNKLGGNRYD